jgi:hypothetical protein
MAHKGLNEGPVSGSHVENRAWRQYPVKTIGKRCACPAKHCVSDASEPTGHRAIPAAVRLAQLRLTWPRRCRRYAAPGAPNPAGTTVVSTVEPVIAPRALAGSRCPGERPCHGAVDPGRSHDFPSTAPARPSSRGLILTTSDLDGNLRGAPARCERIRDQRRDAALRRRAFPPTSAACHRAPGGSPDRTHTCWR